MSNFNYGVFGMLYYVLSQQKRNYLRHITRHNHLKNPHIIFILLIKMGEWRTNLIMSMCTVQRLTIVTTVSMVTYGDGRNRWGIFTGFIADCERLETYKTNGIMRSINMNSWVRKSTSWCHVCWHGLTLIPAKNTCPEMCGVKLRINFQTSTVAELKHGCG